MDDAQNLVGKVGVITGTSAGVVAIAGVCLVSALLSAAAATHMARKHGKAT